MSTIHDAEARADAATLAALRERLATVTEERDAAREALMLNGYRRCDIAACNCGGWHGGHALARLMEIRRALEEADVNLNGVVLLDAVRSVCADRDRLAAENAALRAALTRIATHVDRGELLTHAEIAGMASAALSGTAPADAHARGGAS